MWWNKRSEDVRYCKRAVFYFICLFWNVNVILHIEGWALPLLVPPPLWGCDGFSVLPAFLTLSNNNNSTAVEERNRQTGRKHGCKLRNSAQHHRNRARSKKWNTGKSGYYKQRKRKHWKEDLRCTTDSMYGIKLFLMWHIPLFIWRIFDHLKGKSPLAYTWSSSECVMFISGISQ